MSTSKGRKDYSVANLNSRIPQHKVFFMFLSTLLRCLGVEIKRSGSSDKSVVNREGWTHNVVGYFTVLQRTRR